MPKQNSKIARLTAARDTLMLLLVENQRTYSGFQMLGEVVVALARPQLMHYTRLLEIERWLKN